MEGEGGMEQLGRKGKGAVRAERKGGAGRRRDQIREEEMMRYRNGGTVRRRNDRGFQRSESVE